MTPDELIALNPDWLDAAPIGQCNRCLRQTWSEAELGMEDRMRQPDGNPCGGWIVANGNTLPPKFAG